MNICFYTDFSISSYTGGIGRTTTVLTNYFRNVFGWKVYSIYAFNASANCLITETDGFIQLRLHDRLGFRPLSKNYKRAAIFIKKNNIQVVIIQTSLDVTARLRKYLDQIGQLNVKLISSLHYSPGTDEFPISYFELWDNLIHRKNIIKNIAKFALSPFYNYLEHRATIHAYQNAYKVGDLTILLSDTFIPLFKEYASIDETSKLKTIPNSIPFSYSLTDEEILNKKKTVLMVGRMVEFPKRVSTILKIWQKIENDTSTKDWNLVIVGDGPDLEKFKKQANYLDLQRCTFAGRQDPLPYYLSASIFMMTSEFEGFPMTLVEAEQMGCIPVAFNSFNTLNEVITDNVNGRIVPDNDIEKYTLAILDLMQNPEKRYQMIRKGLARSKKYDQDSICAKWKIIIEALFME